MKYNEYIGMVKYYDKLVTGGYYDYDKFAESLSDILENREKILDMGIGTGILTEKMIACKNYHITGIDISAGMLDIARQRLKGKNVELICEDITECDFNDDFDAAVSTGGVIYMTRESYGYNLYSQIDIEKLNKTLLPNLSKWLNKDGMLVLSIQEPHKNYKTKLQNNIIYEQKIEKYDNRVDKKYFFSENEELKAEQFCQFFFLNSEKTAEILWQSGFKSAGVNSENNFCIYKPF